MTKEQYEKLKEWVRLMSSYRSSDREKARLQTEKELDKLMGFEE